MDRIDRRTQRGTTLIEVLVAMVILAIGLLGLVGLQARLNTLQLESYQRSQALLLLNDMVDHLSSNRYEVDDYVGGATLATPLGSTATCPAATGSSTRAAQDLRNWCLALQGAGETMADGLTTRKVGTMIGGRGCIEDLDDGSYLVTVAWQGFSEISAPPAGVACGLNQFNDDSVGCSGDLCRRTVTSVVRFADLGAP